MQLVFRPENSVAETENNLRNAPKSSSVTQTLNEYVLIYRI
jgi:hypothetical protein